MTNSSNKYSIPQLPLEVEYARHFATLPDHPSVNSKMKRTIDVVGAILGLAITAILIIPIAIISFFDSPGSLFYSQIRYGLKGRPFRIWKFRSMVANADKLKHLVKNEAQNHHIFKNENDPRITRVGRFLRRTSLDELPQFWNVLLGDMSLVGTRPPLGDEIKHYSRHHWQRLNVKPGMTGEWQTKGRSSIKNFEDIVRLDLEYQRKWSIRYDIILILKTIKLLFTKKGAC